MPQRIIHSSAPVRICDNGGWTDTWFAGHGQVLNIAVSPRTEVLLRAFPRTGAMPQLTIHADDIGLHHAIDELPAESPPGDLLSAVVWHMGVPTETAVEVTVSSAAPPGCSMGTSAAAAVALVGAMGCLLRRPPQPREAARIAHHVEAEVLSLQCGIQDQIAAAFGGINFIQMSRYPEADVTPLRLPAPLWTELDRRLSVIYVGQAHCSSEVHERVIAELAGQGPEALKLAPLRLAAVAARDALLAGDLEALGQAMVANTSAQAALHPSLVSESHHRIIDIARAAGATGWKVNGAGGTGGTLTILHPAQMGRSQSRGDVVQDVLEADHRFRLIPISTSREGLRVREKNPAASKF